jgi:Skp family chaperone for outer membrane proteins
MHNMKNTQLGWIVAAALGGILIGGGFQPDAGKMGVMDINAAVNKSAAGIAFHKSDQDMRTARIELLKFVQQHPEVTPEQAGPLHDLSIKAVQTPDDKAKIEEIKKQVVDSQTKYEALQQKPTPTEEERKLLTYYANLAREMETNAQKWADAFQNEMQTWGETQSQILVEKARQAAADIGKAQGFTIIFNAGAAPWGVNDVTDAVTKAMDAKK